MTIRRLGSGKLRGFHNTLFTTPKMAVFAQMHRVMTAIAATLKPRAFRQVI
jgi:hypothetical protein